MSGNIYTYLALGLYFAVLLLIGYAAYLKTSSHEGYMLAGRGLPPWVAALSAGASDMSGWLIMGLPGAIYTTGLIEAWIGVGLLIGAYLNWKLVAPRLRAYTEVSKNSITLPRFFENRLRDGSHLLRNISSVIILVFFTLYCSSGMVAGGKFFESAFGGDYLTGMMLVTVVTLAYTLFGGFLGASLTDVVQGLMMVVALIVVPIVAILTIGGVNETASLVTSVGAGNLSLLGADHMTTGAAALIILSGLAWGLGYFGQPHIVVRFMALRTPQEAKSARRIGTTWQFLSLAGAVVSGLIGIAYFAKFGNAPTDAETVVLLMSQVLLHPLVAGFVLAITVIAGLLAVHPNDSILGLVAFAWAGFGAAFGPLVLLSLYWRKLTNVGAIGGMIAGAAMVFVWKSLHTGLYELLPAFAVGMAVMWLVSLLTYQRNDEIEQEFTQAVQAANAQAGDA